MTGWNLPPGCTGNEAYFRDEPAVTVLKERHIKRTRAEHTCSACRTVIPRGARATRLSYIDYDIEPPEFRSEYYHDICPWETQS